MMFFRSPGTFCLADVKCLDLVHIFSIQEIVQIGPKNANWMQFIQLEPGVGKFQILLIVPVLVG